MKKKKISGYVMASIGFIMLLINAISYLIDLNTKTPAFTILGIIFVVIGLKTARSK